MIGRIACIIFLIVPCLLCGQDFTKYQQSNYTLEDGLPSNECHGVVQDSLGYLWIATDRGLSRFDGYGFKNYGVKEGLLEPSCLQIQLTDDGNIWIRTYSGNLYIYQAQQDTIVPYEYNEEVKAFSEPYPLLAFYKAPDTLYLSISYRSLVKVDKSGCIIPYVPKVSRPYLGVYPIDDSVVFDYVHTKKEYPLDSIFTYDNGHTTIADKSILYGRHVYDVMLRKEQEYQYDNKSFVDSVGNIAFYSCGHIYRFNQDSLIDIRPFEPVQDMLFLSEDMVLTGKLFKNGVKLYTYPSLDDKSAKSILTDVSVSVIFLDKKKNLVVTTLENGIYILTLKDILPVNNPTFKNQDIINIQATNTNNILSNINLNTIVQYSLVNDSLISQTKRKEKIVHVFRLNPKQLFFSSYPVSYIEDESHRTILYHKSKLAMYSKRMKSTKIGTYIIINNYGLREFRDLYNNPIYSSYPTISRLNTIDAVKYRKGYLVGCVDGLYYLEGYTKVKLDSIHPFFNHRMNAVERLGDTYFLGSLGAGLGIWDGKNSLRVIDSSDGLISDNIERIVVDTASLVVCTKSGFSHISLDDTLSIKNYTTRHGLPSNQVNDAVILKDTILLATAKGLAYMTSEVSDNASLKPVIEKTRVNNNGIPLQEAQNLSYTQNAITIYYKTLDYSQIGNIRYRYRLNEGDWEYTQKTDASFVSLQYGVYDFSVQSSNRDGIWSESTTFRFEVHPPWWRRNWFYALVFMAVAGALYSVYWWRLNQMESENETQKEMVRLEKAALAAQMNPHFIFNCLNSIQSYIIQNQKDAAMDYLSRFAKLIRQYLNASVQGNISLDQEVAMLDNYLFLERIRCNDSFDYKITLAPSIDPVEILLPALLIQPIVENAIVHGMKGKEAGGRIEVDIDKAENVLDITVSDNGPGSNTTSNKDSAHRSYGVSITQKRLYYFNTHHDNYTISTNHDSSGTIVNIKVGYERISLCNTTY